jgi:hypothetical protein
MLAMLALVMREQEESVCEEQVLSAHGQLALTKEFVSVF